MYHYENPIIPGFNPDPSICLVDGTFYLVTSTFEYFPGVPVYTSRNLVDWQCIGYCLTRESQLPLSGSHASGGIYAPTIRYYNGTWFMVTTNVSHGGNFIVYTTDPSGAWSEPVWIAQGGIDPSLLFDRDVVYFVSNGDCEGNHGIYLCEINPFTGEMLTKSRLISLGCGGRCAEAPHIYYFEEFYYLLLAEGGTEYGHKVTIQRSRAIYGPYEPCPHNPILSQMDYPDSPIQCTGHADLFQDQNSNWWMVSLGIRTLLAQRSNVMLHNLGRETFLSPVVWKDGWPVVNETGTISLQMDGCLPSPPLPQQIDSIVEYFEKGRWNFQFTHIRNPLPAQYKILANPNALRLIGTDTLLSTKAASPTFLGVRQTAFCQKFETTLSIDMDTALAGAAAGLTVFYNDEHHYDIFLRPAAEGKNQIVLRRQIYDLVAETACIETVHDWVDLKIVADRELYSFYYALPESEFSLLGAGTTAALCTEITRTMTFTGTFVGMFAENLTACFYRFTRNNVDEC